MSTRPVVILSTKTRLSPDDAARIHKAWEDGLVKAAVDGRVPFVIIDGMLFDVHIVPPSSDAPELRIEERE